jgi:predicted ATPase/DNA-binding SARP family transcriptional activator
MGNYSTNLPLQLTSFVGREREMGEVKQLLCSGTTRFLTLTGAGGCGKTRFALQAAIDLLEYFPDGVWLIELASFSHPALIPQTIASVFDVRTTSDCPPTAALRNYFRSKILLLVLDNCEHLIEACADLVENLLRVCPNLHILATSRESFGILGETVWHVPPLTLPDLHGLSKPGVDSISTLTQSEAARLFVDRALAALPTFRLTERNIAAVAQICLQLDGLPLAIELAAPWVKLLSVEQIAARLEDRFALLTTGDRTALPHHKTLRGAMDWSYGLLADRERILFRRLAIFAGGWTLSAAEEICSGEEIDSRQVVDLLLRLVDKSLVSVSEQEGEVRYHFLETVHQYAQERLLESGERDVIQHQHRAFFLNLLVHAESGLHGTEQTAWLKRIESELDNFRATLEWSLCQALKTDEEVGLWLVVGLSEFWLKRNYWKEGREWIERALKAFPRDKATVTRIKTLNYAFQFTTKMGDINAARLYLQESGKLVFALQDKQDIAELMLNRAVLARLEHRLDEAQTDAEASLELFTRLGDKEGIASALSILGKVEQSQGNETAALAHIDESLRLCRGIGHLEMLGTSLDWSASAAFRAGDYVKAHSLFKELRTFGEQNEDKSLMRHALLHLGEVARSAGENDQAKMYYEASLALARELSAKLHIGFALVGLGYVALHQGNPYIACQYLKECLALYQEENLEWGIAFAVEGLAGLAAIQGKPASAARLLGAVDSHHALDGWASTPADRIEHERILTTVRSRLDPKTFDAAWTAGQKMTLEQAAQYALAETALLDITPSITETLITQVKTEPELRIFAFALPRVSRGEREITSSDWKYTKVREMFFYLLCHASRTKEQIGLVLWPDASEAQLRSNFRVAMYHLRHALGRSEWILFENEQYTFNRALPYWFDLEAFESNLAEAHRLQANNPAQAISHLEKAMQHYRGEFLEGWNSGEWHFQRRQELEREYLNVLLTLGHLHFAQAHYAQAADAYLRAIATDSYLETAHRELIRCYARLGECGQALRHYQELVELLRDEVGTLPSPETQALYAQLQRGKSI